MTRALAALALLLAVPVAAADPIEVNLIVYCYYVDAYIWQEIFILLGIPPPPNACDDDPCTIEDPPGCIPKAWGDLAEYYAYLKEVLVDPGERVTLHALP